MTEDFSGLPISASAVYRKESLNVKYDSTILQRYTGKIEEIGRIRRKKFFIICDGKGNFKIREIKNWEDRLKDLEKYKKYLSADEYKKLKKQLMDEF